MPKKTTRKSKQDWHPADIKAALEKQGTSLSSLDREVGLAANTTRNALRFRYPAAEARIAAALGMKPWDIWPSRYLDIDTAA